MKKRIIPIILAGILCLFLIVSVTKRPMEIVVTQDSRIFVRNEDTQHNFIMQGKIELTSQDDIAKAKDIISCLKYRGEDNYDFFYDYPNSIQIVTGATRCNIINMDDYTEKTGGELGLWVVFINSDVTREKSAIFTMPLDINTQAKEFIGSIRGRQIYE